MDTKNQTVIINQDLSFIVAPPVKETIMQIARQHHWAEPLVIKMGGMIDTPVIDGLWRYEPLISTSIIPREAKKRSDLILKSTPVAGVIIGHEIEVEPAKPKVKPLPWVVAPQPEPWRVPQPQRREIDWQQVGHIAWEVAKVIGIIAVAALGAVILVAGAFAGCMTDPNIIVVTPEGEWIEIYRYY